MAGFNMHINNKVLNVIFLEEDELGNSKIYSEYNGNMYTLGRVETFILKILMKYGINYNIHTEVPGIASDEISELIIEFNRMQFFNNRKKRIRYRNLFSFDLRLFSPYKCNFSRKIIAILYWIILIVCIPCVMMATVLLCQENLLNCIVLNDDNLVKNLVELFLLVNVCSMVHELGHMLFALKRGIVVLDIGIRYSCFIPMAYTKVYISEQTKINRVLFNLGGVCANMSLMGVGMALGRIGNMQECEVFIALNYLIILINIIPLFHNDGHNIIEIIKES